MNIEVLRNSVKAEELKCGDCFIYEDPTNSEIVMMKIEGSLLKSDLVGLYTIAIELNGEDVGRTVIVNISRPIIKIVQTSVLVMK
jgi:hypothetical protein